MKKIGINLILTQFFTLLLLLLFIPTATSPFTIKNRVEEYSLKNGMKILMLERHSSPTVSFYIRFKVGSANEHSQISGIAHLLEHMMFKGTKILGTKNYEEEKEILDQIENVAVKLDSERLRENGADPKEINRLTSKLTQLQNEHKRYVIKDEIDAIYSRNGAVGLNASTGYDVTTYKVSLPSNRLELWAKIESDRMLNLVFREFYSERDVVMEERRQMNESQPGGKLFESFMATAFIAHPYRRPIVGWGSNIKFLSKEATERFFKAYYAPNNAVVAIVGDIDPQELLGSIKKHFERVPSHKLPPPLSIKEPEQKGERKIKVNYDAKPRLIIGYHKPTLPEHDDYVFDVIDGLLSSGRTSRLYRRLVEREKIALSVSTANGLPGARYPNLFVIFAKPRHPHTLSELEEAIYREIKLLKEEPVEEKELQKIKNRLKADFVRNLNSNEGLASQLSYYQAVAGDWRYMEEQLNIIEKITPEEIMKVAKKYLIADNRTVAELIKNED